MSSIQSNLCQQPPLYSDHFFSSWWTKKAIHWLLFKGRYTLGDKLQQHGEATCRSDKLLCVYRRIFVKIFVAATEFCHHNKSHRFSLIWFFATCCSNKIPLGRQRFSQKFSSTHKAICCCDMSPHHVAATSRPTCSHGVWSVALTCCCNLSPSVYWP